MNMNNSCYVLCLCISSQFRTAEDVLEGARDMVAKQIAHEPVIRQVVRNIYFERCKITCAATKRGRKVSQCEGHEMMTSSCFVNVNVVLL